MPLVWPPWFQKGRFSRLVSTSITFHLRSPRRTNYRRPDKLVLIECFVPGGEGATMTTKASRLLCGLTDLLCPAVEAADERRVGVRNAMWARVRLCGSSTRMCLVRGDCGGRRRTAGCGIGWTVWCTGRGISLPMGPLSLEVDGRGRRLLWCGYGGVCWGGGGGWESHGGTGCGGGEKLGEVGEDEEMGFEDGDCEIGGRCGKRYGKFETVWRGGCLHRLVLSTRHRLRVEALRTRNLYERRSERCRVATTSSL